MLGKLMKYEWKATKRTFLPLYGALLVLALINGLFFRIDHVDQNGIANSLKVIVLITYIAIIIATFVMTAVVMLQRYYKNILGREGYLMNTLPVKGYELIWSKGIVSTLWFVGSTFVVMVTIPIIFFITSPEVCTEVISSIFTKEFWTLAIRGVGRGHVLAWMMELLVMACIACFLFCMKAYAAMSLGHLTHKSRMMASVGFYIAIDFAERAIVMFGAILFGILFKTNIGAWFGNLLQQGTGVMGVHVFFIGVIVYEVILTVVYFFISKYVLDNKLNLE